MDEFFPLEALTNHVAILGKTGSGKTTAAKGFAEGLLDAGKRVCAIDPTGVWWGLRLKADGRTPGYLVIIFGGDHADVPISELTGARLAQIIAEGTFSCVIDTSTMTVGARTRFFTEFAEALFRANKRPLHLIVDEAHVFAPQGRVPDPQSGRMLHAANNLVSGGRSRGLRIMLISQRPAKLHKDSLTQVEMLIAMRLIAPQDRAAVEAWIGEWADAKQGRDIIKSLPSLSRGEGWVWAPELNVLEKLSFPRIRTFDSSQTPEDGEPIQAPSELGSIDLDAIRASLAAATPEGTEPRKPALSKEQLEAAEERGYQRGLLDGTRRGGQNALKKVSAELMEIIQRHAVSAGEPNNPAISPVTIHTAPSPRQAHALSTPTPASKGKPELRILRVLAARHPARFTPAQWATLSRMKRTGGTWANYVSLLRRAGFLDERDGTIGLTPSGVVAAGDVERPPAGSVIRQWKDALGSGPAKMIDVLIEAYPRQIDRANLADRVNMTATGGTFANYLSLLRTNGLVEVRGRKIAASPTLFLDQAEGRAA